MSHFIGTSDEESHTPCRTKSEETLNMLLRFLQRHPYDENIRQAITEEIGLGLIPLETQRELGLEALGFTLKQ